MEHLTTNCIKCQGLMRFPIAPNGEPQAMGVYKFKDCHFDGEYVCEICYGDYRDKKKPLYARYAPNGFVWQFTKNKFCEQHKVSRYDVDWNARTIELWKKKHKALWRLYFIMLIRFDNNWKDGKKFSVPSTPHCILILLKRLLKQKR